MESCAKKPGEVRQAFQDPSEDLCSVVLPSGLFQGGGDFCFVASPDGSVFATDGRDCGDANANDQHQHNRVLNRCRSCFANEKCFYF